MKKARVGIIVDNLNSSKQIFDFITASQKSNNYEVSHIIIQKISKKKNQNFLTFLFKEIKIVSIPNFGYFFLNFFLIIVKDFL